MMEAKVLKKNTGRGVKTLRGRANAFVEWPELLTTSPDCKPVKAPACDRGERTVSAQWSS
jgi:hypothetical protein